MQPQLPHTPSSPTAPALRHGVVLLTSGGPMSVCAAAALAQHFGALTVLEEKSEPKWHTVRRRARRLGWRHALGQVACEMLLKLIERKAVARIEAIKARHGLATGLPPTVEVRQIDTVNSKLCRDLLRMLQPRAVAVYGTRAIRREVLTAVPAPFIECRLGIDPKYRGQHPGYWALVNGDAENAGATIHLVEEGVDTGGVLYQPRAVFGSEDNIATYQWVQLAHALPSFCRAIEDALEQRLTPREVRVPSRRWFPPTLWGYAWNGWTRGVW